MPPQVLAENERVVAYVIDGPAGRRVVEAVTPAEVERWEQRTHGHVRDCAYCGEPHLERGRYCSTECEVASATARRARIYDTI